MVKRRNRMFVSYCHVCMGTHLCVCIGVLVCLVKCICVKQWQVVDGERVLSEGLRCLGFIDTRADCSFDTGLCVCFLLVCIWWRTPVIIVEMGGLILDHSSNWYATYCKRVWLSEHVGMRVCFCHACASMFSYVCEEKHVKHVFSLTLTCMWIVSVIPKHSVIY